MNKCPHYVKFPHHMGKLLFNLTPSEPLASVKKLPYFDEPIECNVLLEGILPLGVDDPINYLMFNVVMIDFCRGHV